MAKKIVLRVGVYNNFNFTEKETEAVRLKEKEGYLPFVNSNSFVRIKNEFPSILTINPYFQFVEPVGDLSNVKACRIKYIVNPKDHIKDQTEQAFDWCQKSNIPILITFMRFRSKNTLNMYSGQQDLYEFKSGYYRLKDDVKKNTVKTLKQQFDTNLFFCDEKGEGCPSCGNCSKLTYGGKYEVESLSLSCSGDEGKCIFNCPDCWAKNLGKFVNFKYDEVTKNNKQKGHNTVD